MKAKREQKLWGKVQGALWGKKKSWPSWELFIFNLTKRLLMPLFFWSCLLSYTATSKALLGIGVYRHPRIYLSLAIFSWLLPLIFILWCKLFYYELDFSNFKCHMSKPPWLHHSSIERHTQWMKAESTRGSSGVGETGVGFWWRNKICWEMRDNRAKRGCSDAKGRINKWVYQEHTEKVSKEGNPSW